MPPSHLISRLVALSQHLLALRISSFLGLSSSPVTKHWAQQLIAASAPGVAPVNDGAPLSDEDVSRLIVDKLQSLSSPAPPATSVTASASGTASSASSTTGPVPDVPLSSGDIALTAFRLGRPHLAALLIEREPRAGKQVPLLLRMGEGEEAMKKAVKSGDPELGRFFRLSFTISCRSASDVLPETQSSKSSYTCARSSHQATSSASSSASPPPSPPPPPPPPPQPHPTLLIPATPTQSSSSNSFCARSAKTRDCCAISGIKMIGGWRWAARCLSRLGGSR